MSISVVLGYSNPAIIQRVTERLHSFYFTTSGLHLGTMSKVSKIPYMKTTRVDQLHPSRTSAFFN